MSSFQLSLLQSFKALPPSCKGSSLKVVILGSKGVGKTSFVRRFVSEELGISIHDVTPTASSFVCSPSYTSSKPLETITTSGQQNPEVGLDIYELELPLTEEESDGSGRSLAEKNNDSEGENNDGNVLRLSIWDYSGNTGSLQSVQKVFFTPQALYVVLWDMAVKDVLPLGSKDTTAGENAASYPDTSLNTNCPEISMSLSTFKLGYDSDSDDSDYNYYDDCDVDLYSQEEILRTKRKLEMDIDKKVQCWIDHIQAISPGATVFPLATHIDRLCICHRPDLRGIKTSNENARNINSKEFKGKEGKMRCWLLKERLISNEAKRVDCIHDRISAACNSDSSNSVIGYLSRPKLRFGNVQKDGQSLPHAIVASCIREEYNEFDDGSMHSILSGSKTTSGYEYDDNFLLARNFIRCTALAIAAGDSKRLPQEQSFCGRDPVTLNPNYRIAICEPSISTSLASAILRNVRQKLWHRSKIVQTNYITGKFDSGEQNHEDSSHYHEYYQYQKNSHNNSTVFKALDLMHHSGELCFFGGLISSSERQDQEQLLNISLLSDFVVLDPTWLVESIDFILQYAKKCDENNMNSRTKVRIPDKPNRHRFTNCSAIEKDEVKRLWKNRFSTKQELGLAEHYHQFQQSNDDSDSVNGVADQVFEFIHCLLTWHDVVVPLSFQLSESERFFVPSLVPQRKADVSPIWNCCQSNPSILRDFIRSNNVSIANEKTVKSQIDLLSANLQAVCHGLIFVDVPPETLMGRIFVHLNKSLRDVLKNNYEPTIKLEEFNFWKDAFRLKLYMDNGDKREERTLEINSVLLEAPGCGTSSHIAICESMLVTFSRGCDDFESHKLWRQTYLRIRNAMQNVLDEIRAIEYREEGICPKCLNKKAVRDVGTWKLSKLQSSLNNEETFVRCRHGHLTALTLNGFLQSQIKNISEEHHTEIDDVQTRLSEKTIPIILPHNPKARSLITLNSSKKSLVSHSTIGPKEVKQFSPSSLEIRRYNYNASKPKPSLTYVTKKTANVSRYSINNERISIHVAFDNIESSTERRTTEEKKNPKEIDRIFCSKVTFLFNRCRTKIEQLFDKKNHLDLRNRNMTEADIPMEELNGTECGRRLRSISLSHNRLETLPECLVRCLTNLRFMNISHCFIYDLPKKWNLPLLKKLDISHNLLIQFPEESVFMGLSELEELNLSGNKIKEVKISDNPKLLRKLKRLDLSSNELVCIPTCLDHLPSLKSFDLQCNNIWHEKKISRGRDFAMLI